MRRSGYSGVIALGGASHEVVEKQCSDWAKQWMSYNLPLALEKMEGIKGLYAYAGQRRSEYYGMPFVSCTYPSWLFNVRQRYRMESMTVTLESNTLVFSYQTLEGHRSPTYRVPLTELSPERIDRFARGPE